MSLIPRRRPYDLSIIRFPSSIYLHGLTRDKNGPSYARNDQLRGSGALDLSCIGNRLNKMAAARHPDRRRNLSCRRPPGQLDLVYMPSPLHDLSFPFPNLDWLNFAFLYSGSCLYRACRDFGGIYYARRLGCGMQFRYLPVRVLHLVGDIQAPIKHYTAVGSR